MVPGEREAGVVEMARNHSTIPSHPPRILSGLGAAHLEAVSRMPNCLRAIGTRMR